MTWTQLRVRYSHQTGCPWALRCRPERIQWLRSRSRCFKIQDICISHSSVWDRSCGARQERNHSSRNIRCMQHLPDCTALPAIYLLIVLPPVKAMLDIRTLSLFRSVIAADVASPPSIFIRELIIRQLAMKDSGSSSWTYHVKSLLQPAICIHSYGRPPR